MKKSVILSLPMALSLCALSAQEQQPNILWIITDDHRADALECYNMAKRGVAEGELGYVSSPNLNRIAAEGTLFVNSGCNCPASAPSRSSMMTGRQPFRSGIFGFLQTHNTNDSAHPVVPEIMSEAGYNTTTMGKTGFYIFKYTEPLNYKSAGFYDFNLDAGHDFERKGLADWAAYGVYDKSGYVGKKEVWQHPDGTKTEYFTDRKKGEELSREDVKARAKFHKQQQIITAPNTGLILAGENTMPTHMTNDGYLNQEFCRYIDNADKSYTTLSGREAEGPKTSEPQFIHLGYHFPHTPVMPSKEYRDKFKDLDYTVPKLTEAEYSKMPEQIKSWVKKTSVRELTEKQRLQMIRDYYAFCAMGDELIGEAVDKFKKYCEDNDQPYIILIACGDHGWHLGEQGVAAKFSSYYKSNETAVIISSSDKKTYPDGKIVTDFVEYVDFAPTFFSAAGVDVSDERFDYLDGYDIAKVAAGDVVRDYVLGESNHVYGARAYMRGEDFSFAMRSKKNSAPASVKNPPNSDVKWALECTPEQAEMTLFDLRVDPEERNNVAYDPAYKELAAWFRTKLGNIVLGDRRMEVDWKVKNSYDISTFALGSDDKRLEIPAGIIPEVKKSRK